MAIKVLKLIFIITVKIPAIQINNPVGKNTQLESQVVMLVKIVSTQETNKAGSRCQQVRSQEEIVPGKRHPLGKPASTENLVSSFAAKNDINFFLGGC